MTREQPNYYSIIPANVRYDENLKANEKLLYGEITALANKNGYCWAENKYFAELYKVHKKTVSEWIGNLEKQGYISIKLEYIKGTKQVSKRYIYIKHPIHEKTDRYPRKDSHPIHEKTEEELNTTSINNTSTNKDHSTAKAERIPYKEIIDYLNGQTGRRYSHTANKNKDLIRARWNEGFRLQDFKEVIDTKVKDWNNDSKMNKYLRPATLFSNKFDEYLNQSVVVKTETKTNDDNYIDDWDNFEKMIEGD